MMIGGAVLLAASLSQSAPATAAPVPTVVTTVPADSVRVHFSTPGNKLEARLWAKRAGDSNYTLVCAAPCRADIPGGTPLRVALTDHEDEPYDFVLSNDSGREVEIIARRAGRGALAGGIVMTSVGGLTAVIGIILTAFSFGGFPGSDEDALRTAGLVTIGIGAGLVVGGVAMISGRTYEPSIRQTGYDGGRRGANETNKWATVPLQAQLPVATTPFSLTFTF